VCGAHGVPRAAGQLVSGYSNSSYSSGRYEEDAETRVPPPLGVTPRFAHEEHRLKDLEAAIYRFNIRQLAVPQRVLQRSSEDAVKWYCWGCTKKKAEDRVACSECVGYKKA
jgi:hypothetical protein